MRAAVIIRTSLQAHSDIVIMTVETANISASVPPKKREYSEYPVSSSSPDMSELEMDSQTQTVTPTTPSPPPVHHDTHDHLSPAALHHLAGKTAPLRSSGFMITDILSGASAGLPLPMGLAPQFPPSMHRVHSPHDTASSDAGSYKENDISDEGEEGKPNEAIVKTYFHSEVNQTIWDYPKT